jgi:hypothetical protein
MKNTCSIGTKRRVKIISLYNFLVKIILLYPPFVKIIPHYPPLIPPLLRGDTEGSKGGRGD